MCQLGGLGVRSGGVLLVHTSFRAVRPVEGGPLGLVEALLDAVGSEGTLVMPSWSGADGVPFDRRATPASPDLGVVADTFWRLPRVMRSDHVHAFAAKGPQAAFVTSDPLPLPPHRYESPVGRVYDCDGQVLLLGVGHDANTTVHLAEVLAGVPYWVRKSCTVTENGALRRIEYEENDHCCARFALLDDWLEERRLQRTGTVGHALAKLIGARDIVEVARARLGRDPLLFLHPPEAGCAECDEARRSVA